MVNVGNNREISYIFDIDGFFSLRHGLP
jgi:hypothetical protein